MNEQEKLFERFVVAVERIADALTPKPPETPPSSPETLIQWECMPQRAVGPLRYEGIYTYEQLCQRTADELLQVRNLGELALSRIREHLRDAGFRLKYDS